MAIFSSFSMRTFLLAAAFLISSGYPSVADRRVALIIGNGDYARVPKLANPVNDATAIEGLFKAAKFDKVVLSSNLSNQSMRRTLRNFADDARDADIAVIFFAGHGMEMNGINYLVPVDAVLERDIDIDDEAIALHRASQVLEGARRLRLIILDACRDNPFARSIKRTLAGRSIGRGLAPIDVVSAETLVAYAAKAGSTAADGITSNSPYTMALLKHLTTPGLDIRLALGRVRDDVLRTTGNQEPFFYGSLGGAELSLMPPPAKTASSSPSPSHQIVSVMPASAEQDAAAAWASVKDAQQIEILEAFAIRYSSTFHGELARRRIAHLKQLRGDEGIPVATAPSVDKPPALPRQDFATSQRPAAPDPNCLEAPSDAPDVVIRTCSSFLSQSPSKSRTERALNRRGLAYFRSERYSEALSDFNRLIASNRMSAGYFDNRAAIYRAMRQYELAVRDSSETIRLNPDRAYGYHARGNTYIDMGKYELAIADFTRAFSTKDGFIFNIYDRGRAYAKLGRFDLAVRDFTTVLETDPNIAWAYRERGLAHLAAGAHAAARADLQRFIEKEPNDPEAQSALHKLKQKQ